MAKPERVIQSEIMLAAHTHKITLWRNNVGTGWQGKYRNINNSWIFTADGSRIEVCRGILIENPRPLRAGLCEGSSDLIGIKRIIVTPDMVGQTLAVFTAVEVKAKRKYPTKKQKTFLDFVSGSGGISVVARSAEDLP